MKTGDHRATQLFVPVMESILVEQLPASRRSLRLAVVTETYPPEINGVALSLSRFVEGLRERNHDIQLIRPRQALLDQPARRERFDELLTLGMPIPRYPDLKMGLPAKRALIKQIDSRQIFNRLHDKACFPDSSSASYYSQTRMITER